MMKFSRRVATCSFRSNLLCEAIKSKQIELGRESSSNQKQDFPAHWNSTLDMIEEFIELEDCMKDILDDEK